jgi:O-acetyl-ADP-ribose deacetylase (regulator of RNase III)
MITYLIGDATRPKHNDARIILHIVNRQGKWGKGFVLALSKRWKKPELEYRKWFSDYKKSTGDILPLGAIQIVEVDDEFGKLYIVNMCAQDGFKFYYNPIPFKLPALVACLFELKKWMNDQGKLFSIHMPRIGCNLGGSKWEYVEKVINKELMDENVFVYDLN